MRDLVITSLLTCLLPIALARPYIGMLAYYWMAFMIPQQLAWGSNSFPWAKSVALLTALSWIVSGESKRLPVGLPATFLIAFFGWTTFTLNFALFPDFAVETWTEFMKIVAMSLLLMTLINSQDRVVSLLWVIVISIGYYTVKGGVFVLVTAGNYNVEGPSGSPFFTNNGFARAAIMVLPPMYFLYVHAAHRYVRFVLATAMLLTALALAGTNSRGGFLAFGAMLLWVWINSRHKVRLGATVLVVLALAWAILPQERIRGLTERASTISRYDEQVTAQTRFHAWRWGYEFSLVHPIVGGGFEAFRANLVEHTEEHWQDSHSNYFQVLGEHGYVGLTLYVILALAAFRSARRIMRQARGRPELYWARDLAFLLGVAMVGYFAGGLTISHAYVELYYTLIAILVATERIVLRSVPGQISLTSEDRQVAVVATTGAS